jgi:hypothetical protein
MFTIHVSFFLLLDAPKRCKDDSNDQLGGDDAKWQEPCDTGVRFLLFFIFFFKTLGSDKPISKNTLGKGSEGLHNSGPPL